MSTRTAPTPDPTPALSEAALLGRLGLPPDASTQDVETAHDQLIAFLETAPSDTRGWADREIERIDEAYALLSDPTIDRTALVAPAAAPTASPSRAAAPLAAAAVPDDDEDDLDDLMELEEAGDDAAASRRERREAARRRKAAARRLAAAQPPRTRAGGGTLRRVALIGAGLVGVVAIAIAGFNLNGGTGVPPMSGSPAPEAEASTGVDPAQVSALMERIQADPSDVASLQALADLYYQAGDFATAGSFLQKILAVEPDDVVALLALGATQYNQGDVTGAEQQWRAVLANDADNVDAHYYLGFMYLAQEPPDMVNARKEWDRVIEIDPDSEIAKSVSQHLASLSSPAPSGSAAPAGSPAPAASPAGSPAPATSPTTSAAPAGD
jgi:tetratricopeptide (TPR) repeat protein